MKVDLNTIYLTGYCKLSSLILLLFLLFISIESKCQNPKKVGFARAYFGVQAAYGNQVGLAVDYRYKFGSLQFNYFHPLILYRNWHVDLFGFTSIGIAKLYQSNDFKIRVNTVEVGLNGGVFIYRSIYKTQIHIMGSISSGPIYLFEAPSRQSSGWNFASNCSLGLILKVSNRVHIVLQQGVRHVSNLGLRMPNGGINNMIFGLGIIIEA